MSALRPGVVEPHPANAEAPAALVVEGVRKRYEGAATDALRGVSLSVAPGEFVSLLGPSGCGKTTLLRCVAGLEDVSGGTIALAGERVSGLGHTAPPHRRRIGMVFQSYALWPHMTVLDNVAYPLKMRRAGGAERRRRARELLALLDLEPRAGAYAHELSGGQQQRVALARALAGDPEIVLFDEPLSNLDARLRELIRLTIRDLAQQLRFTALYVTHDRLEAMVMSDRIVLMNGGEIVQEADPVTMFRRPATRFAAEFLGDANFVPATVIAVDGAQVTAEVSGGGRLRASTALGASARAGERVELMLRVGCLRVGEPENALTLRLEDAIFTGETWRYRGRLADGSALSFVSLAHVGEVGDELHVGVAAEDAHVLAAR